MKKVKIEHTYRVYLPMAILFVILSVIFPRTGKFNYDYKKGAPWMYETLVAQFDFPVLKTNEQLQAEKEQASSAVIPYYRYSDNIVNESISAVQATSLGLKFADPPPFDLELLTPDLKLAVFDTIYLDTPLLKRAKELGLPAAGGSAMLLYQGAKSFEIWTGLPAPIEEMRAGMEGKPSC